MKWISITTLFILCCILFTANIRNIDIIKQKDIKIIKLRIIMTYKNKQLDSCKQLSDYLNSDKVVLFNSKIIYK